MKEQEGDSVKAGKEWLALKKWSAEEIAISYLTALSGMDALRSTLIRERAERQKEIAASASGVTEQKLANENHRLKEKLLALRDEFHPYDKEEWVECHKCQMLSYNLRTKKCISCGATRE